MSTGRGLVSVVIPTLDEEEALPGLLDDLDRLDAPFEIVVVDGGSSDHTVEIARRRGAVTLRTPPGRGIQLRRGAEIASGSWFVFLHADSRLDVAAGNALLDFLTGAQDRDFAHFRLAFDQAGFGFRVLESGQRLRERLLGLPYGDQGLVVSRSLYEAAGGHPEWPIMEDVGIIDRLARHGRRVGLAESIRTSGRRYERVGVLTGWLRNVTLMTAFRMGVAPERLVRWYRPERRAGTRDHVRPRSPEGERWALIVFAKNPRPGEVKTRLAEDVGDEAAARIYRRLGHATLDAVVRGPWSTTVHVSPADDEALASVENWLGPNAEYEAQVTGDLGRRMAAAIQQALRSADAACVIGTDLPDMNERLVRGAFTALATHDVVLGPATDGGYYLIGMKQLHIDLFRKIPWSSDRVLERTLDRARTAGLRISLLEERNDVDTVDDLTAELQPYLVRGRTG